MRDINELLDRLRKVRGIGSIPDYRVTVSDLRALLAHIDAQEELIKTLQGDMALTPAMFLPKVSVEFEYWSGHDIQPVDYEEATAKVFYSEQAATELQRRINVFPLLLEALENLENDDRKRMPPGSWQMVQKAIELAGGAAKPASTATGVA
ncbi:hypothetical protein GCM10007094_23180 [Pseudovibrio japonicus]|uniref:Uncharacterized protein n=1 Tax=Pseudovibrio japonicus TaxID=366534 RepID=A0ABQ3ECQ8_9HYPH|nr:hypothetical protein [Pseudovibrio japonicus]GHB33719.1 hypothetical protein GCM10007094_23180 [Pseudovibrio japonicus]